MKVCKSKDTSDFSKLIPRIFEGFTRNIVYIFGEVDTTCTITFLLRIIKFY